MIIKINQIKMPVNHTESDVISRASKIGKFNENDIVSYKILKKSIDARKSPVYIYSLQVELRKYNVKKLPKEVNIAGKEVKYNYNITGMKKLKYKPVIVGFGPAGMFCSLMLAEAGYSPIILERGRMVDDRIKDVEEFWKTGKLNTESNIQFGEGGAGTFSDGKLNTGVKEKYGRQKLVLETFVRFGAPENILYDSKPHIGTDILCKVVKNMRNYIIEKGGEFHFDSKLTNISEINDGVYKLEINNDKVIKTEVCVLAIGHSARDTFEMLYNNNFNMVQKPFAVGIRVEHRQHDINTSQYGTENYEGLPAAPYKVTYNTEGGRGVYSFCMCPGGYVVNASSEKNRCVVNGMSYSDRAGENANSAIVTTVTPDDFPDEHPLSGVEFQRELEEKAYREGNGDIPIQLFKDFKENKRSERIGKIMPSIKGKYTFGNMKKILPDYICSAIEEAMPHFGKNIEGFDDNDVVFSGVESRTSSPVRIVRDDNFHSNYENIYPCGEGAGYAGGITSAAMDGVKVFEAIISIWSLE